MRGNASAPALWSAPDLFQFTPLHERQRLVVSLVALAPYFNSRLYMRGNTEQFRHRLPGYYFNSRLYMRGNILEDFSLKKSTSFQFTPLHERQRNHGRCNCRCCKFQFTPLHERQREHVDRRGGTAQDFNSRLYMRGNTFRKNMKSIVFIFQFTPLHERQRRPRCCLARCSRFQFTPLHERQPCSVGGYLWGFYYFNSRLYMRGNSKNAQFFQ